MDNPDITMEEYLRLNNERSLSNKKVYDWERARYGAQVINDKEPTMEEYLLSKQEESGKEKKNIAI